MPISANRPNVGPLSFEFVDASIRVIPDDGHGEGVHWPDLDEDVSVNALPGSPT